MNPEILELLNKYRALRDNPDCGTVEQQEAAVETLDAVLALLDKVKTPAQLPSYETLMSIRADVLGLLVLPKGRVYKIATTITAPEQWTEDMGDFGLWEITGPFAAVGSGGDAALVAMECGKKSQDAVRIACKYDPASRPPIHSMPLEKPAAK